MKRRIFNVLAAVSLVLCVATVVLWCLSYRILVSAGYHCAVDASGLTHNYGTVLDRGTLAIVFNWRVASPFRGRSGLFAAVNRQEPGSGPRWLWLGRAVSFAGFHFGGYAAPQMGSHAAAVPCWFLAAITLASAVWCVIQRPSRQTGLCQNCGYDMRATPDRCPECGTVPTRGLCDVALVLERWLRGIGAGLTLVGVLLGSGIALCRAAYGPRQVSGTWYWPAAVIFPAGMILFLIGHISGLRRGTPTPGDCGTAVGPAV